MIIEILKKVHQCDLCGKQDLIFKCVICGVEHCWDCAKQAKNGREFPQELYLSKGSDPYFCRECLDRSDIYMQSKLLQALTKLQDLQTQYDIYYTEWKKRVKATEEEIKNLMGKDQT